VWGKERLVLSHFVYASLFPLISHSWRLVSPAEAESPKPKANNSSVSPDIHHRHNMVNNKKVTPLNHNPVPAPPKQRKVALVGSRSVGMS